MAMMIDINTDSLRNAVDIARRANESLTEAMNLLNQVVIHEDWGCPERDSINHNTITNREAGQKLQAHANDFYNNIAAVTDEFLAAEETINQAINTLDGPLSQFLSLVPSGAASAGVEICSFGNIVK